MYGQSPKSTETVLTQNQLLVSLHGKITDETKNVLRGASVFLNAKIILSIFSTNMLGEHFVTSAGNTGSLFGVPTFVPGPPRMTGTKLTWKF